MPLLPPLPPTSIRRRVVVTGLGLVSGLGESLSETWAALMSGATAVRRLPPPLDVYSSRVGARMIPTFRPENYVSQDTLRKTSPFINYALAASSMALKDSDYIRHLTQDPSQSSHPSSKHNRLRAGVSFASGVGGLDQIESYLSTSPPNYRYLSPFFVPKFLINLASGHISLEHGLQGPNLAPATACSAGAHAIADAYRVIRDGEAELMVAGGSEGCIIPTALAGFSKAKALSTRFNETPERASRPFDRDRDGFVIGEGAGALVLEELSHALSRKSKIYAEVRGYGFSGDAHHLTAPPPDGDGARRAMERALQNAGLEAHHVDYINAHATSTPLGDLAECYAIKSLFANQQSLKISSTKGATGHLLGAAGAVEAIFSILAISKGEIPPTVNLENLDEKIDLDIVRGEGISHPVHVALSNSFGFGGTNCSLVFALCDDIK
eukprot:TRINITY_DN10791_c0_g1_i1.p1 TRINITY_DN10791_c0_g1~~TRINITY_DN10791_c0_g1_i1.p1  ORF type:complete len:439 (+),score=50.31 TRINITY_DN10791_c0_g1_i1:3-1319(+)